jgi:hypothetical protein
MPQEISSDLINLFMAHLERGKPSYDRWLQMTRPSWLGWASVLYSVAFLSIGVASQLPCQLAISHLLFLVGQFTKKDPKYLHEKLPYCTWKPPRISERFSPSHLIGKILDFYMFVHRPVAIPNWSSRYWRLRTSEASGLRNSIASSTYKLVCILMGLAPMEESRPCVVTISNIHWSGSIARMNSIRDKGSPSRRPWACLIGTPGWPLSMIRKEVVLQIRAIMSCHRWPKPSLSNTSSTYSHQTLSKAFVISSLSNSICVFTWWKWFVPPLIYWKLSWILRPLIKALRLWDTSLSRCGASRFAKIFASSLTILCIILMGR